MKSISFLDCGFRVGLDSIQSELKDPANYRVSTNKAVNVYSCNILCFCGQFWFVAKAYLLVLTLYVLI